MNWIATPSKKKFLGWSPHLSVVIFGDGRSLSLDQVMNMGSSLSLDQVMIMAHMRRGTRETPHLPTSPLLSPFLPCKDRARRQPSTRQKESPHQKLIMPVPCSGTSGFQNYEKKHFHCLDYVVQCFVMIAGAERNSN